MSAPCGRRFLTFGRILSKSYVRYRSIHTATISSQLKITSRCTEKSSIIRYPLTTNVSVSPSRSYATERLGADAKVTESVEESSEPDVLYKTIELELKCAEPAVLSSYEKFLVMAANELGITISNIERPRYYPDRITLLKSAFVHKKHRVQYEIRTHFRIITLKHLTGSTADTYLEYIQRNLSEGIAMKVTRHEIRPVPDHIKPPPGQQQISSNS